MMEIAIPGKGNEIAGAVELLKKDRPSQHGSDGRRSPHPKRNILP